MKNLHQVHRKGGKQGGFPQAQNPSPSRHEPCQSPPAPDGVTVQFLDPQGKELARQELSGRVFQTMRRAAALQGQPLAQFITQAVADRVEQLTAQADKVLANLPLNLPFLGQAMGEKPDRLLIETLAAVLVQVGPQIAREVMPRLDAQAAAALGECLQTAATLDEHRRMAGGRSRPLPRGFDLLGVALFCEMESDRDTLHYLAAELYDLREEFCQRLLPALDLAGRMEVLEALVIAELAMHREGHLTALHGLAHGERTDLQLAAIQARANYYQREAAQLAERRAA